jgi:hypothetical protein
LEEETLEGNPPDSSWPITLDREEELESFVPHHPGLYNGPDYSSLIPLASPFRPEASTRYSAKRNISSNAVVSCYQIPPLQARLVAKSSEELWTNGRLGPQYSVRTSGSPVEGVREWRYQGRSMMA